MTLIKSIAFTSFVSLFLLFSSCSKVGIGGPSYTVDGIVNGAQVVPASTSSASGIITGSFDGGSNTLLGTLKWAGLSGAPTAIHIHGGMPGKNGYPYHVMVTFPKGKTDSLNFRSVFTESEEGGISKSAYYFDIHTAAFPQGEVRGQIIAH